MLSNTLVYLIGTEISAILFFYRNVYGGLNVKNKKLFLQRFHASFGACQFFALCYCKFMHFNAFQHFILLNLN